MGRPAPLVPLPEPLARAIESLRAIEPPRGLAERLLVRLAHVPDEAAPRAKRRLIVLGGVVLALAIDLSPLLASAQDVAAHDAAARVDAADETVLDDASQPSAPRDAATGEAAGTRAVAPDAPRSDLAAEAPADAGQASVQATGAAAAAAVAPTEPATATSRAQARPAVEDFRFSVSLLHGIRFEAPRAAGLTIELHASLWLRAELDHDGGETADFFSVPLARIALSGSAFDGLVRFFLQPELAGSPRLLDAQVELALDPGFVIRVGQFRTPFSRSFITGLMALDFPDRGLVANTFNAGRDTGLLLYGRLFDDVLEYDVGVFNGSGINGRIGDTPAPMVMGRLAVTPFGSVPYDQTPSLVVESPAGVMFGVDGYYRVLEAEGAPNLEQHTASVGADAAVAFGPFSLQTEGFLRWIRTGPDPWTMAWAAYAQAGVFVIPRILELAARGGWVDPSTDAGANFVQTYEAAVSGYFALDGASYGQHLKLVLAYRFADARAAFGDVPVGRSHRVTAQAQLFF